ncbi:hypothetical protein [Cryptosporangium aurantiacum]|uniref:Uncharacterized protein n=1 Tax=Cryptosporangium aurantiacum TaxID=134849 RepID=A0A1M7R7U3_9ACTN|nr:hypothetical protein [Cryptosporangium aurantiacum]SHN42240.1 hypothetical protein SAMN05443668_108140 [Cryptosporangium aurantiacum]
MTVPPPGPLVDEAVRFAEALLQRVRGAGAPELPPELVARFSGAVADAAVAGADLLRVVAEVATVVGERAAAETDDDDPPVERIDIG